MRIRWNPIVKKDLQVSARSMRLSWGVFAYDLVLVLAFLLALAVIQSESSSYYNHRNIYSYLIYLFPVLAVAQVCIVALVTPVITASSISGEKERQTFDMMLTTCMSPFSIVLGKLVSAVIRILFFVVAGIPVMALSFVVGGLVWTDLLYFVLTVVLLSVFSGSIGIFCSSVCRRSISAVVLSFVIYFVVYVLTFVPAILMLLWTDGDQVGETSLFLLVNPGVFLEEFFMQLMTGESAFGNASYFSQGSVGFVTSQLAHGKVWMFLSALCILVLAFWFLIAAAWKVDPLNKKLRTSKAAKDAA